MLALVAGTTVLLQAEDAEARRYASIVIDASNGRVLHAENPDRKAYPASLTKIMTLYMVFDAIESGKLTMNSKLKVSKRASRMPPSKLGLRAGSTIKVKDAVLALITKSANDVAVVVAESIGGTESNFARMMTRKARALGMSRTTFRNASGLPNRKQLSTARDMAKLGQIVMRKFPKYYKLFSTKTFTYRGRKYGNHNKLLKGFWGTDGIKTGYTHASGFNLVASTVRNNRRLIGVVFGGKTGRSRDKHMQKLLARAFKKAGKRSVPALVQAPKRKPWGDDLTTLVAEAQAQQDQQTAQAQAQALAQAQAQTQSLAAASLAAATQATGPGKAPTQTAPQTPPATTDTARPTASLPSLQALVTEVEPTSAPDTAAPDTTAPDTAAPVPDAAADPIGAQIASLPGWPSYDEIPKRPTFDSQIGEPGSGVKPPAYAAIPQRPDNNTAQGSNDSPVPMPPQYGEIPRRPDLSASNSEAEPKATQTAGNSLGSFKLLKPRQTAAMRGTLWGVQVGAFRRLPLAELTASEVARAAPHQLNGLDMEISQAATGNGEIYRARFTGADETRARKVCEHLKAKNISCVVVPPAANEG